ncbi:MAG: ArsR/SmtB family transcription factor [Candidatus Hodarchaeales archaeon]|jgi:DNA-binding transcriptional ArsR family regulator
MLLKFKGYVDDLTSSSTEITSLQKSIERAMNAGYYPPSLGVGEITKGLEEKRLQARSDERQEVLKRIAAVFKCLASPKRLELLSLVSEREMCVCEIQSVLETSIPNISQHLRILENAGMITTVKRGQFTFVSLNMGNLMEINQELRGLLIKEDT